MFSEYELTQVYTKVYEIHFLKGDRSLITELGEQGSSIFNEFYPLCTSYHLQWEKDDHGDQLI
eukprot:UN07516